MAGDVRVRRVERVDPAFPRPVRMHEPAERAAFASQQPVGVRREEPALRHHAERREPDAGAEARTANVLGERREPARKALVRLEPVSDRALVAVVELHEVDRELDARLGERFEIAEQVGLAHLAEELVPAAPARLERAGGARARTCAELFRERLEQPVRIVAQRDEHPLQLEPRPRLERRLDARLDLDEHVVSVAAQVHDSGGDSALEQTGEAAPARPARHRHQIRLVPARAVGRRRADAMVHPAQPGARREGGLAGVVERAPRAERPGLPAVAQETQIAAGRRPAEAQHHGLEPDAAKRRGW